MSGRPDDGTARRLLEAERRIVESQDRFDVLGSRKATLDIELQGLHAELDTVVRRLEALGRSRVEIGDFRRTTPLSPVWGLDRGVPLDRYYIHAFLDRHRHDIKGRVLEIKDPGYTRMFGDDRVTSIDVLDVDHGNAQATIVTDLSRADTIAGGSYDCFILTQTLGVIFDVAGALRHAVRVLKPGGVLLCTVPASGRISYEEGLDGDFWRFTEASVRRLFAEVLPPDAVEIAGHGNVLVSAAFLYGMAVHELTREELDACDPYFPVVYTIRAVKPAAHGGPSIRTDTSAPAAVLTYHRVGERAYGSDGLTVPAGEFEAQMRHLVDAGHQVLPLDEMVASLATGTLSKRAVSLTFDDGYADTWSHAAPVLESLGLAATFFVVGAALDGPYEFWWDTVDRILLSSPMLPAQLERHLAGQRLELPTATQAQRLTAREAILERLYPLTHEARASAVRVLVDWSAAGAAGDPSRRPMTADEVVRLAARRGVTIGAHTEHHEQLPRLSHQAKLTELRTCRSRLEALVGRPVTSLSYPYGYADDDTVKAAREAGFELAVTTEARGLMRGFDRLRLPRLDIGGSGMAHFKAKLDRLMTDD
jgi:peptidoglycan/xylan/chitin deacetylase (PgdA/CDA1 family)